MINTETIEVLPLFPSPLFTCVYTEGNLDSTIKFLDSCEMKDGGKSSEYGFVSKNTYILEHPECKLLANFIIEAVEHFTNNILMYDYEKYVFSQSWISHKIPNQSHISHVHPNSLISGVFYYGECNENTPAITFHKSINAVNASYISPKYQADRRKSQYAWEKFHVNPSEGLLLLFPSYTIHSVPLNQSNKIRKSLAFNVLPKGKIGDEENLTELLFHKAI
jgi:uncharacterized protein (TIGR02466 family)